MARHKKLYRAAVRFSSEALNANPALSRNPENGIRYNAACAATLAAAGKGEDAAGLDDKERIRLREQARDWLTADIALWAKVADNKDPKARELVRKTLQNWQSDADLAGIRDAEAVAKLPEAERDACKKLWEEVAAVRKKADGQP